MKTAVFEKQDKIIIASANLIVIRPKDPFIGGYIKLFLESPFGLAIIKSFQRGTKIMNINHSDIGEIEIPYLPVEKQYEMVSLYNQEQQHYQQKIQEAENQLQSVKQQLYSQLLREKDG
jgi:restriction endonuclease S subunit